MILIIKYFLYKFFTFLKFEKKLNSFEFIIFSKDRPLQLNLLLESLFHNVEGLYKIKILYSASDDSFKHAYTELKEFHCQNEFLTFFKEEISFKHSLVNVFKMVESRNVFFLVDDIIFKEKIDLSSLININKAKYVFSLRNGLNLNFSYVVQKEQPVPNYVKYNTELITWNINESILDWAYPLSVDGHLFSYQEVFFWVNYLEYSAPNTFEMKIQFFNFLYKRKKGLCFEKSIIFNNPCNKVQSEVNNLHGTIHQDKLLEFWNLGLKIDYNLLKNYLNCSVHEEVQFKLIQR